MKKKGESSSFLGSHAYPIPRDPSCPYKGLSTWILFHTFTCIFYNAEIRSQLDVIYIILQHVSIFVLQEIELEACRWEKLCSRELPYLAITSLA